jgi:peptide/nickel transport system permease protein
MTSTFVRVAHTLRRTLTHAIPTIIGIVILNFLILQLVPGDAADVMAGESGAATASTMGAFRERFGLDLPVMQQLWAYLYRLAHFDLGFSPRFNVPVSTLIGQRMPGTITLMLVALITAILLGLLMGALMASFAGRLPDRLLSILSLLFYSIPGFWTGLMLIVVFSLTLGWLPSGGSGPIVSSAKGFAAIAERGRYLVLPALSLALFYVAIYARLTRASMLEVRSQDFVRTAVAKGLSPISVTVRHVLRNALLPVIGIHLGGMLGGAVVVETVYNWPGLGRLAFEAILGRDFNVLLGILLLSSMVVIIANVLVDIVHTWLDPRIGGRK